MSYQPIGKKNMWRKLIIGSGLMAGCLLAFNITGWLWEEILTIYSQKHSIEMETDVRMSVLHGE